MLLFISKCFKRFMDNIHAVKEKKQLRRSPFLPYLGSITLQTRTTLKRLLKSILNCCKLQIVFKNKTRLGNNCHFKYRIHKNLVYKFQCHWVKSVQIRSYFWSVFSCIRTEYGNLLHNLRIQSEYKKIRTRNNSVFGHISRCVWTL